MLDNVDYVCFPCKRATFESRVEVDAARLGRLQPHPPTAGHDQRSGVGFGAATGVLAGVVGLSRPPLPPGPSASSGNAQQVLAFR